MIKAMIDGLKWILKGDYYFPREYSDSGFLGKWYFYWDWVSEEVTFNDWVNVIRWIAFIFFVVGILVGLRINF